MLKDFKEFAMKGNIIDMAIGVIIGGAFGKIVGSLVNDLIMPLFGIILGEVDFSSLSITIGDAAINYGLFINTVVEFLIISFSIFLVVNKINKYTKKDDPVEEVVVTTKLCPFCKTDINIEASRCPNCTSEL